MGFPGSLSRLFNREQHVQEVQLWRYKSVIPLQGSSLGGDSASYSVPLLQCGTLMLRRLSRGLYSNKCNQSPLSKVGSLAWVSLSGLPCDLHVSLHHS